MEIMQISGTGRLKSGIKSLYLQGLQNRRRRVHSPSIPQIVHCWHLNFSGISI